MFISRDRLSFSGRYVSFAANGNTLTFLTIKNNSAVGNIYELRERPQWQGRTATKTVKELEVVPEKTETVSTPKVRCPWKLQEARTPSPTKRRNISITMVMAPRKRRRKCSTTAEGDESDDEREKGDMDEDENDVGEENEESQTPNYSQRCVRRKLWGSGIRRRVLETL